MINREQNHSPGKNKPDRSGTSLIRLVRALARAAGRAWIAQESRTPPTDKGEPSSQDGTSGTPKKDNRYD